MLAHGEMKQIKRIKTWLNHLGIISNTTLYTESHLTQNPSRQHAAAVVTTRNSRHMLVGRWVPSYVGHCTFLPNCGNYQQDYTTSLPGTRKSTTFKCIFFGAPALGCASKSLVTLVAQQPYKRRDLFQVICHAVRDGMLTHVSSPPPDADTFIPIYSYRRCNLYHQTHVSPHVGLSECVGSFRFC
jgi:hypothetical protein